MLNFVPVMQQLYLILKKEDKSLQWFEKAKEKGLEDLSEISNNFFSKTIDDWIKNAKFWGPLRVEENNYKEEL